MQLSVTTRNLEITPALRSYAEEKLTRLTKYLEQIVTVHVVLSVNKHRQTAEVTLRVRDLTRGGYRSDQIRGYCRDPRNHQVTRSSRPVIVTSGRGAVILSGPAATWPRPPSPTR